MAAVALVGALDTKGPGFARHPAGEIVGWERATG